MPKGFASPCFVIGLTVALGLAPRAAHTAAMDFAAARRATDAFARQSDPEAKLWRVDATASLAGGTPEVLDYVFHYV